MRAQFIFSEIAIGLRRNLSMAFAVVITVGVSLAIFGGALLVRDIVTRLDHYYYGKLEVSVFLKSDVTEAQRQTIGTALQNDPRVASIVYESSAEAFNRFKAEFSESPELVASASPDTLPESYRVKLKDPKQFAVIASEFAGQPGVDVVKDQRQLLHSLFSLLDGVKLLAFVVGGLAGAGALLQTFNTIRLAAFSRRREIGIMRLVGASNFSIQLPFLLEGALAGLVGGIGASVLLAGAKGLFLDNLLAGLFRSGVIPNVSWDEVLGTMPLLLGLGAGVSALAAYVTSLLYVRV